MAIGLIVYWKTVRPGKNDSEFKDLERSKAKAAQKAKIVEIRFS